MFFLLIFFESLNKQDRVFECFESSSSLLALDYQSFVVPSLVSLYLILPIIDLEAGLVTSLAGQFLAGFTPANLLEIGGGSLFRSL